jgi:hypothetical protein
MPNVHRDRPLSWVMVTCENGRNLSRNEAESFIQPLYGVKCCCAARYRAAGTIEPTERVVHLGTYNMCLVCNTVQSA